MQEKIWEPLGINNITFYPKEKPHMQNRRATISTLNEKGEGPAVDAPDFDVLFAATDCLGGAGGWGSAEAFFTFLQAVLRRDPKLLSDDSFTELFKSQLDERCEKELNDNLKASPIHTQFLGLGIPTEIPKQWSFAGLINQTGQDGRFNEGTIMWGGVPSMTWVSSILIIICRIPNAKVACAVSRSEGWRMRNGVLPGNPADEPKHSGATRAVPESGISGAFEVKKSHPRSTRYERNRSLVRSRG
jgi:hypothetical protein